MVLLTFGLHQLLSYRRPLSFWGCVVGPLSNAVAAKMNGKGNQVAVTEVGQVLAQHGCITLHDHSSLTEAVWGLKSVYGVMLKF